MFSLSNSEVKLGHIDSSTYVAVISIKGNNPILCLFQLPRVSVRVKMGQRAFQEFHQLLVIVLALIMAIIHGWGVNVQSLT